VLSSFCISSRVLGTKQHLICDSSKFSWSSDVPDGTWFFDGTIKDDDAFRCLDTLVKLSGASISTEPGEKWVSMMNAIVPSQNDVQIPWRDIMPARDHAAFTKGIINSMVIAIDPIAMNYYRDIWEPGSAVMRSLQPAKINARLWSDLITAGKGNIKSLVSFEPDSNGYAQRIKYNRFGSRTGRLTRIAGADMLTLNKEFRVIIESAYGNDGCIVNVDFAALEARVMLYEAGKRCDDPDLYGMIAREMGDVSRTAVKGGVISELYGSSKLALGERIGLSGKDLNNFVKRIKTHFNTKEMLSRIKQQFVETGYITNRFGRRVKIDEPLDHIFINSYAQSTGQDVALLGFHQIIESVAESAPRIRPLFLLHDGAFFDVPKDDLKKLTAHNLLRIKGYIQKWPIKFETSCDM
jgi:hypothetical protein